MLSLNVIPGLAELSDINIGLGPVLILAPYCDVVLRCASLAVPLPLVHLPLAQGIT